MIVLIMLFWVAAIGITYQLGVWAGTTGEDNDTETFVELTPSEADEFVLTWFLAIFVWGVIINELRIVIISLMAPIRA